MNEFRFTDIVPELTASFKVTVTTLMMDTFRQISGDTNPLHTDPEFASKYGYADRVVYGLLTASFYSTLVGLYLPGKYALFQGADIAFTSPVYPFDTLTVWGKVVAVNETFRQIEIKAHITNQHGCKVSRAKIRTGIHE